MIKELSARERFLLNFLAVFLLAAACFYFVIGPTIEHTAEMRENVDITLQTKQAMTAVINGTDYDAQVLALENQLAGLEERLLPFMSNSRLDSLITGEILSAGLTPSSLTLGTAREEIVAAFGESVVPGASGEPLAKLTQNTAGAVFSGTPAAFGRFLEAIAHIDGVFLTYAGYSKPPGGSEYQFTVSLVFYMAEEGS